MFENITNCITHHSKRRGRGVKMTRKTGDECKNVKRIALRMAGYVPNSENENSIVKVRRYETIKDKIDVCVMKFFDVFG